MSGISQMEGCSFCHRDRKTERERERELLVSSAFRFKEGAHSAVSALPAVIVVCRVADPELHGSTLERKAGSKAGSEFGSALKSKFRSCGGFNRDVDAHNGGVRLKLELQNVYRPVVADSHHFDEEQDPDMDPH
jgi:hypothetical protein